MSTLLHELKCNDGLHSVVIEDNGRVAYAYLIRDRRVISDLWLYNQADTPEEPEWRDRTKMPFLNSRAYVNDANMARPLEIPQDVVVEWDIDTDGFLRQMRVFLRGKLYGILAPTAKPGWCIAAQKDGPLAKCLAPNPT